MNMDWNTALSIVFIVIFVIMMLRGGCMGGRKGGSCDTKVKPQPSQENEAPTGDEASSQRSREEEPASRR